MLPNSGNTQRQLLRFNTGKPPLPGRPMLFEETFHVLPYPTLLHLTTSLIADSCSGSERSTSDDFTVAQPEPLLRLEPQSSGAQSPGISPRRCGQPPSPLGDRGLFGASITEQIQLIPGLPALPPVVTRAYHQLWAGPSRHASSAAEASMADELEEQLVDRDHAEISRIYSHGELNEESLLSGTDQPRVSRAASRSVCLGRQYAALNNC